MSREHGRDYDRERRHDRSHEDDGWRRRRAWESDRNQAARESRPDWGEGAHEDERASAAERLSAGHGREWRQGEGSRERPRSEDREPGSRDHDSGYGHGRRETRDRDRAPEQDWARSPRASWSVPRASGDPDDRSREVGSGSAGNWGSSPTRSGSFGELGGQGFLGGGPTTGQPGGGRGRGEWAGVGGRGGESWRGSEDRPPRGSYAGRGPKGYRRSDERIEEEINERLERHPEIDATEIQVTVQNGEVTLSGSVEDRRAKRLAEDLVDDVYGVKDVQNQLRTSTHPRRSESPANDPGGSDPGAHPSSTLHGSSGEAARTMPKGRSGSSPSGSSS